MMTLPVSRTYLSPNHSDGWLYGQPNKVVIHSTRSGQTGPLWTHNKEMQATINWFLGTNSSASSNLIISPTEIVRVVPDEFPSWHTKEHSWQAWGIEVTQPTVNSPIEEGHYKLLVEALRHYQGLGVHPVWLPSLAWGDTASGWIQHKETAQGIRDGKSDIGYQLDKARLLNLVLEEDDMDPALEQALKDFHLTPYTDRDGRVHISKAAFITQVQDYFDSDHLQKLFDEHKAIKDALISGGVDVSKIRLSLEGD